MDTSPMVDEMPPLQPGQRSRQEETALRTASFPRVLLDANILLGTMVFPLKKKKKGSACAGEVGLAGTLGDQGSDRPPQ